MQSEITKARESEYQLRFDSAVLHFHKFNTNAPDKPLKTLRLKNKNHPITGQINIIFIKNKFDLLLWKVNANSGTLLISETKIDGSFSSAQFLKQDFSRP